VGERETARELYESVAAKSAQGKQNTPNIVLDYLTNNYIWYANMTREFEKLAALPRHLITEIHLTEALC
jgi:hypothetical protein